MVTPARRIPWRRAGRSSCGQDLERGGSWQLDGRYLAKLLAAATTGAAPAGPASKRQPIHIALDPDGRPVGKGMRHETSHGFNLQAATRLAAKDKPGRESRYILHPRFAAGQ